MPREPRPRKKPAWGKIALVVAICAALAAAWRWTPLAEFATADHILAWSRAALVSYGAGRLLKRDTVRRLAGERIEAAAQPLKAHGVLALFAANMMPAPPFAVQNMIAGALRIPLAKFMLGTALSLVPPLAAWALLGSQIHRALEDASRVSYWAIGAALALAGAFVYLSRRWARARGL